MVPHAPTSLASLLPFARAVESGAADRLWLGQAAKVDPHQLFAHLSGSGVRVPTGTAVTLAPLRNPYEAALQARSVALLSGRDHIAGYGAGSSRFVASITGSPYPSALTAMREYLTAVRALLTGDVATVDGQTVRLHGRLVPLGPDEPAAPVRVGAGVLRPGMARVAGATADVAITWLTPPGYIADAIRPALQEGAADRPDGPPRVCAVVHVLLDRPDRDPVHQVLTASSAHLSLPHYRRMLRAAGVAIPDDDPVTAAAELITSGTYLYGSAAEIAAGLDRWAQAGVDEVAINVAGALFTAGEAAAVDDLTEILSAVATRSAGASR